MADNDSAESAGNASLNEDCIDNICCKFDAGCSVLYLTKKI